jgi:hypothetical protein
LGGYGPKTANAIGLLPHDGESCARLREFDKIPQMCYYSVNNLIIWTLLSRGVEGPAQRSPGNQVRDSYTRAFVDSWLVD